MRQLIIAFADSQLAQGLSQIFRNNGLSVNSVASSGLQALSQAANSPDGGLIVCPANLPDMPAQELMKLLPESFDLLVLLTSRQNSSIRGPGIFTLIYPFSRNMIAQSAKQILATRQILENDTPRHNFHTAGKNRSGSEQMLIEQAKLYLMNKQNVSEQEAHRYLQKQSMETGVRMAELARRIIGNR